jgi:hypothetical protein
LLEKEGLVGEQRADSLLVMRPVAGHGRHEPMGRATGLPDAIPALAASARFIDQPAQRNRSASRAAPAIPSAVAAGSLRGRPRRVSAGPGRAERTPRRLRMRLPFLIAPPCQQGHRANRYRWGRQCSNRRSGSTHPCADQAPLSRHEPPREDCRRRSGGPLRRRHKRVAASSLASRSNRRDIIRVNQTVNNTRVE